MGQMDNMASEDGHLQPPRPHKSPPPHRPIVCYGRILLGEITPLLAAMRRSSQRWTGHNQDSEKDPLVSGLRDLQTMVSGLGPNSVPLAPHLYLDPFLAIIRSEDTTGPVTKDALAAVNRMIGYGLITPPSPVTPTAVNMSTVAAAVESIASAVTHARFVGTDAGADEVVLWEILAVLRSLVLSSAGCLLTNESVCEILNSSFRICFETRLSDLLRTCTEDALRQMVTLIFARLPFYTDEGATARRLKMRTAGSGHGTGRGGRGRPGKSEKTRKLAENSKNHQGVGMSKPASEKSRHDNDGLKRGASASRQDPGVRPESTNPTAAKQDSETPKQHCGSLPHPDHTKRHDSTAPASQAQDGRPDPGLAKQGSEALKLDPADSKQPNEVVTHTSEASKQDGFKNDDRALIETNEGCDSTPKASSQQNEALEDGIGASEAPFEASGLEIIVHGGPERTEALGQDAKPVCEADLSSDQRTSPECTIDLSSLMSGDAPQENPECVSACGDSEATHAPHSTSRLTDEPHATPEPTETVQATSEFMNGPHGASVRIPSDAHGSDDTVSASHGKENEASRDPKLASEPQEIQHIPDSQKEAFDELRLASEAQNVVRNDISGQGLKASGATEKPISQKPGDEASSGQASDVGTEAQRQGSSDVTTPDLPSPSSVASNVNFDTNSIDSGITDTDISAAHLATSMENLSEADGCMSSTQGNDSSEKPYVNSQGVKFTQDAIVEPATGQLPTPYGLPCVRELLRFLVSLTSPQNDQNTGAMILTSLNLLTVALEVGAADVNRCPALLAILRDPLCRNLMQLLSPEAHRIQVYMAGLRLCALMCESLRTHIKYQIEYFLLRVMDIITSEAPQVTYTHRELALETLVELWRIPGFTAEIYGNYDCDLYASNLFEDLTKVLSKHAFPVQGLYNTNILCLDALLTVMEQIEKRGAEHAEVKAVGVDTVTDDRHGDAKPDLPVESCSEGKTVEREAPGDSQTEPCGAGESDVLSGVESAPPETGDAVTGPESVIVDAKESAFVRDMALETIITGDVLASTTTSATTTTSHNSTGMAENPSVNMESPKTDPQSQESHKSLPNTINVNTSGAPRLVARLALRDEREVPLGRLAVQKEKKRIIATGTDLFNTKPEKGIRFLQEHGILTSRNEDIALFLRQNPRLCKRTMGNYLSSKKNVDILAAFVHSFDFRGLRVDEALRAFLESFRLPGEAPMISLIMEYFASHWHESNARPFRTDDTAFTLAYAVIMLNVDQHNQNARRQNVPMTLEQFRNNLRGINDGADFDGDMLEEVYHAVRAEEFVMPSEQTGEVRENYVWKMLLKRGTTADGDYILTNGSPAFDRDLFALAWGPTIASLSYVFDKSNDDEIIHKTMTGFGKCALIAARYGLSDVFDNLVVTLCKFTGLGVHVDTPSAITTSFGLSGKAQLAARTVFRLVLAHGDILRDGWRNAVDVLLQLFRCRLLPDAMVYGEDFVDPSGKVRLISEPPTTIPRVESGLLSSLYSYIALVEPQTAPSPTPEEENAQTSAKSCVKECHLEKLISESVFLHSNALSDLLKAVMNAGDVHHGDAHTGQSAYMDDAHLSPLDENAHAFLIEVIIRTLIANKDRAHRIWPCVRAYLYEVLLYSEASERNFLMERTVIGLLRLCKVLLRRPALTSPILNALKMVLVLKHQSLMRVALQVVCGLKEVLSVNTEAITEASDWLTIFTLIECVGAGALAPPAPCLGTPEAATGADDPHQHHLPHQQQHQQPPTTGTPSQPASQSQVSSARTASPDILQGTGGWILVGREGEIEQGNTDFLSKQALSDPGKDDSRTLPVNEYDIVPSIVLGKHRVEALSVAVDTLAILVRDRRLPACALPSAAQACRTFVEATIHAGLSHNQSQQRSSTLPHNTAATSSTATTSLSLRHPGSPTPPQGTTRRGTGGGGGRKKAGGVGSKKNRNVDAVDDDADDDSGTQHPLLYQQISEKLLDLMGALHTTAGEIVGLYQRSEASRPATAYHTSACTTPVGPREAMPSVDLWAAALCPLLQGIARYCCDARASIRNLAMTYLQRALLNHDLLALSPLQWESLFNKVLFPLLAQLLMPPPAATPPLALEESRVRAATLVQKVYLRHLTPLLRLPTFTALWLTILEFMDKYLNTHRCDHLNDAIPEILKNMLLVMETTQVFHTADGFTRLWSITWDRIDSFLPSLRHHLFRSHPPSEIHSREQVPQTATAATASATQVGNAAESKEADGPQEDYMPPTLREQQAARLSLSEESIPHIIEASPVILQPPLPAPPSQVPSPLSQSALSVGGQTGDWPVTSQSQGSVASTGQSAVPIILQSLPVFMDKKN